MHLFWVSVISTSWYCSEFNQLGCPRSCAMPCSVWSYQTGRHTDQGPQFRRCPLLPPHFFFFFLPKWPCLLENNFKAALAGFLNQNGLCQHKGMCPSSSAAKCPNHFTELGWSEVLFTSLLSTPIQQLLVASGGLTQELGRVRGGDFGEKQGLLLAGAALVTQEGTVSPLSHGRALGSAPWESPFCQMQTLCCSCQQSCFFASMGPRAGCSQHRCPQKSQWSMWQHWRLKSQLSPIREKHPDVRGWRFLGGALFGDVSHVPLAIGQILNRCLWHPADIPGINVICLSWPSLIPVDVAPYEVSEAALWMLCFSWGGWWRHQPTDEQNACFLGEEWNAVLEIFLSDFENVGGWTGQW